VKRSVIEGSPKMELLLGYLSTTVEMTVCDGDFVPYELSLPLGAK